MSTFTIVSPNRVQDKSLLSSRDYWKTQAAEWVEMRLGIAGAKDGEFCAGYIGAFKPIYARPGKVEGESWFVWLVESGVGACQRIVNEVMPGVLVDAQNGEVYEHDSAWVVVLGTVTRIGNQPLLTLDMLRGSDHGP
jgi:hypothetical protein